MGKPEKPYKHSPRNFKNRAKKVVAEANHEWHGRRHGTAESVQPSRKNKTPEADPNLPVLEVLPERDWCRKVAHVPFISTVALRAFIEAEASPLRKVIAMANGHEVNGIKPSWDDQKYAIYALLPKVAPDLKSVEVVHSDGDGNAGAQLVDKLVDTLAKLALAKRAGGTQPITIEHDAGQSRLGRKSQT